MRLYRLLGVAKSASKQEIKQAYRKLALQFHPDKHALSPKQTRDAAADKFKQMSAAYQILVDDRKRTTYDRISDATETKTPPPPPPPPRQKQHEYRRAYTYENKQGGGGSKETRDEKQNSWASDILTMSLFFIFWDIVVEGWIGDKWRESRCKNRLISLQKKHESEVEALRIIQEGELEEQRTRHERQLKDLGSGEGEASGYNDMRLRYQRYKLRVSYVRELEEHLQRHQDQLEKQLTRHERECNELREKHARESEERRNKRIF